MLRCVPGPVALVVLCGEADTLTLALCACLGACVLGLLFCARVCWVVCQICACMMGRASANVRESGPWFAGISAVHYTSGLVYRAVAQGPVCQTALGLVSEAGPM